MRTTSRLLLLGASLLLVTSLAAQQSTASPPQRWRAETAREWYQHEPWLVGSNYLPASAENELEMWQAATFDPARMDKELGWAQDLGMNTMRVFLHDLLWKQDSEGFKKRIDIFLGICNKHQIKPMFVLFDSVWDPSPHLGPQPEPIPGVHNSRWMQSPGAEALRDPAQYPRLQQYVTGIVGAFAKDRRILAWDIWNEPDNMNGSSYARSEPPNKIKLVLALLPQAFAWARSVNPQQPLTSGIWHEALGGPPSSLSPMARAQLALSDVISFHNYDPPVRFKQEVRWLRRFGRPLICTEYMARAKGSTFETILPVAKQYKVGAINWGFVAGRSQTFLPWDSWQRPYVNREPSVWFHDIFRSDGTPYRPEEVDFIRRITESAGQ